MKVSPERDKLKSRYILVYHTAVNYVSDLYLQGTTLGAVQSTDATKDQDIDVARGGVVCSLAEWCMPWCSVLGSVASIPT